MRATIRPPRLKRAAATDLKNKTAGLQGMVVAAFDGIGLSLVIPNAQSVIADFYGELDR